MNPHVVTEPQGGGFQTKNASAPHGLPALRTVACKYSVPRRVVTPRLGQTKVPPGERGSGSTMLTPDLSRTPVDFDWGVSNSFLLGIQTTFGTPPNNGTGLLILE